MVDRTRHSEYLRCLNNLHSLVRKIASLFLSQQGSNLKSQPET